MAQTHSIGRRLVSSICFTLDLEDHRPDDTAEVRFPAITDALLDDLDEWGVRGTVFVVGDVVKSHPDLVARVAARGHELGLHAAHHIALPDVGPHPFRRDTAAATDLLSQTIQAPVTGFRAPIFSLVPESAWAPEILVDLGFEYSSSVLPARNPLYGWPGAPSKPFRWPSGLIEIPSPAFGFGSLRLPLLGGTYLRAAPKPIVSWAARRSRRYGPAYVYSHPYDFDPDEKRWIVPEAGRFGSWILWLGRAGMKDKVRRLVSGSELRLCDLARSFNELAIFDPEQPS